MRSQWQKKKIMRKFLVQKQHLLMKGKKRRREQKMKRKERQNKAQKKKKLRQKIQRKIKKMKIIKLIEVYSNVLNQCKYTECERKNGDRQGNKKKIVQCPNV
ncbi:hypothetical protein B7P43_G07429 [Cryptotermes secundus]|uniref:Uncharacterized protein n=1 Tax=Cryptotermes secundus TaxID=105785 RepID=A0A2J7R8D0_9NEOP|nr:hypothetical protein B7P43_G07429 [Cryptotermes secundus]